jgi:hypothetical protein
MISSIFVQRIDWNHPMRRHRSWRRRYDAAFESYVERVGLSQGSR